MSNRNQLAAELAAGRIILADLSNAKDQIPNKSYLGTVRRAVVAYIGEYKRELNRAAIDLELLQKNNETPIDELVQQLEDFPTNYAGWLDQAEKLPDEIAQLMLEIRETRREMRLIGREDSAYGELETYLDDLNDQLSGLRATRGQVSDDLANAVQTYEQLMEQVFQYDIQFAGDFEDQAYIDQLTRLRDSNLAIVAYFDEVMADSEISGLDIFSEYFATAGEEGIIRIVLGADQDNSVVVPASEGWTPLPGSVADPAKLRSLYLGSNVTVATITHEFYHQLDRYFDLALSSDTESDVMNMATYLHDVVTNSLQPDQGFPFDRSTIKSGASSLEKDPEVFADLGMTATLSGRGFIVRSDGVGDAVAFEDTINARDVECALQQYLYQVLTGATSDLTYVPCE